MRFVGEREQAGMLVASSKDHAKTGRRRLDKPHYLGSGNSARATCR